MALEIFSLSLAKDGRLPNDRAFSQIQRLLPGCTDCFVFCPGWLDDPAETNQQAARFFALLENAMRPLGDRTSPLWVALHWPSRPFGRDTRDGLNEGLWPELSRHLLRMSRSRLGIFTRLLMDLCGLEVPLSPEEACELDGLRRRLDEARPFDATRLANLNALRFWVMKRRAGDVGERFGREHWAPFWGAQAGDRHRLHLIGHSFGATLLTSSVLGGICPQSLTLLLGAFSAFALRPRFPAWLAPASTGVSSATSVSRAPSWSFTRATTWLWEPCTPRRRQAARPPIQHQGERGATWRDAWRQAPLGSLALAVLTRRPSTSLKPRLSGCRAPQS